MRLIVVSIYDRATEAYMRPWFAQSPGQAVRMFEDEVNRPDSQIAPHAEDYALFQIGHFTDHNGELHSMEPHVLSRAHEVIAREKADPRQRNIQKLGDSNASS